MNILLSLIATASMAAQDMNKLVSAEVRGASAPIAIAELSKQVGYPLEAMLSTKEDFLIIKVTDVPLNVLLQKIAAATNTEWEQTTNGLRLIRTDPIRRREAADEQAKLAIQIQTSLEKTRKKIAEDQELTTRTADLTAERLMQFSERQQAGQNEAIDWREQQRLNQQGPAYRMMRKISVSLDAKTLASVPEGENVVMSNIPNRMQVQLPGNIQGLVQTFVKEQTIWAKALKTARERRTNSEHHFFENAIDPSQRKIGKVLLILSRNQYSRGIQARLIISDEKGRLVGSANDNFGWDWEAYSAQMQELRKATSNEADIKFSGTSKMLMDSIQEMYKSAESNQGQPNITASPQVRELLINPDKNEPLGFVATDCVFETARIRNLDIVCSAPDIMVFGGVNPAGNLKPATFMGGLTGYSMEAETKDNWLVLRPTEASAARKQRADRVVLGQYLRQAVADGRLTIENRATYAYRSGKTQEDYLPTYLLSLTGILKRGMEYGGDWNALRLYGSLTPPQRQMAKTAQPIQFRSLQAPQLAILRHIVFNSPYSQIQNNYEQEDFADVQGEDGIIYGGGLDSEPTEVLPNGFTGGETLTIKDVYEPKFFSQPDQEPGARYFYGESSLDLQTLAFQLFQHERPELFPWLNEPGYSSGKISKIRLGHQRMITFDAQFTRKASLNLQLQDKTYSGDYMTLDKLPAATKKQLEEALVNLRQQHKDSKPPNWNPGGGGGAIPPPPPLSRR